MRLGKAILPLLFFMLCCNATTGICASWQPMPLATKLYPGTEHSELGTAGEGFQYVYTITYAPSAPNIAFFGTDTTGVWKSEDGGVHWRPVFNGYTAQGACSVVVDPINPNRVLAAAFLGYERSFAIKYPHRLQGIYLSEDGGENWNLVHETGFYARPGKGKLFAFDSTSVKDGKCLVIYAGSTDEGLLRSNDGGLTWQKHQLNNIRDIGEIYDLQESPQKNITTASSMLVATSHGFFKITGNTALELGKELPQPPNTFAVTPANPNLILVAVGTDNIYRSTDGGKTFIKASWVGSSWFLNKILTTNIADVALSPVDANIAYARADRIGLKPFYSSDGGKTWRQTENSNKTGVIQNEGFYFSSPFAPHPEKSETALHVSNGRARILSTNDGGKSWEYSGWGFSGAGMSSMSFPNEKEVYLALLDHGLWYSNDNCRTFTEIETLERLYGRKTCGSIDIKNNIILVSVGHWSKRGIALSKNSGKTWSYSTEFETSEGTAFISPDNSDIMFIGSAMTTNGGESWHSIGNEKTGHLVLHAVQEDKDEIRLFALGEAKKSGQMYVSSDLGTNWAAVGDKIPVAIPGVKQLIVTNNILYAATARGVFYLDLNSKLQIWLSLGAIPKDAQGRAHVNTIAITPGEPNDIWIGLSSPGYGKGPGVYRSTDGGKTWVQQKAPGIPLFTIIQIKISPFDKTVYFGTYFGSYTYKR